MVDILLPSAVFSLFILKHDSYLKCELELFKLMENYNILFSLNGEISMK